MEKRGHPRFAVGLKMDIRSKGAAAAKTRGTITDISASGMAFRSNAVLEEGMCLCLKLDLPLDIRGEVRHVKGPSRGGQRRYGVRFHKIA